MRNVAVGLLLALVFCFPFAAIAQDAPEVTVSLNEQFLNSFLDAVFNNLETPVFPLAKKVKENNKRQRIVIAKFAETQNTNQDCTESVTLLRESEGVRTAVYFKNGKIIVPIAFKGTYRPTLIGCVNFQGWAETNLNLEYDAAKQILYGRVKVQNIKLNGIPNLAGGFLSRMVQGTIDSRINPLEILRAEQVSPVVPVSYANGAIRLKPLNMKTEVVEKALNVRVKFAFVKAE